MPTVNELASQALRTLTDAYNSTAKYLMHPVYNAVGYNAKGDGIGNDTAAISCAIADATTKGGTVSFSPGTYKISSNITVPENVTLHFQNGAKLSVDAGVKVTINGPVEAGIHHIFSGAGTIAGSMKVTNVVPQWFGAKGDGVTDDTQTIKNALAIGKDVVFPVGTYLVSDMLILYNNQRIRGSAGKNATQIIATDAWDSVSNPALIKMSGDSNIIESMLLKCPVIDADVILIDSDPLTNNVRPWEPVIRHAKIIGGKHGINVKNGLEARIEYTQMRDCDAAGIYIAEPDVFLLDVSTDGCKFGLRCLAGSITAYHFHAINSLQHGFYLEGADWSQFTDCHADTSGYNGFFIVNSKNITFLGCWSFQSSAKAANYDDWNLVNASNNSFTNCRSMVSLTLVENKILFLTRNSIYINSDTNNRGNVFVNCNFNGTTQAFNGLSYLYAYNKFVACLGTLQKYNRADKTSMHNFSVDGGVSNTFSHSIGFTLNNSFNVNVFELTITARENNSPSEMHLGKVYVPIANGTNGAAVNKQTIIGAGKDGEKYTITAVLNSDGITVDFTLTNNSTQRVSYGIEVQHRFGAKGY